MSVNVTKWLQRLRAFAGGGLLAMLLVAPALSQNQIPQARPALEAGGRQEDRLNRDARKEAEQRATSGATGAGPSAGLRSADFGVWLNSAPGVAGLVVGDLDGEGAFAQAGLREGDSVISINGQPITSETQFAQVLQARGNQLATLEITRNGQPLNLSLQAAAALQGVAAFDPLYQTGLILDDRDPNRVVIQRVFPRTTAYYAGLRPGDVITGINGQQLATADALTQALQAGGGANLGLAVTRNGQVRQLNLNASGALSQTTLRLNIDGAANTIGLDGARSINPVNQAGFSAAGRVVPDRGTTLRATVPGTNAAGGITAGAINPSGTAATAPGTPPAPSALPSATASLSGNPTSPAVLGNPISPSLPVQPATPGAAAAAAVPGARTAVPGAPTAVPGLSPSGGPAPRSSQGVVAPGVGGGVPARVGGGTGSTAGGAGAVGGTGAFGGAGSTAGGAGAVGGTGATRGGSVPGPKGSAAGGIQGGAGGPGGAGAGGT